MPWKQTADGSLTRFRLSGGWSIGSVFALPFVVAFIGVFGPGFLGVGSMILTVTCDRVGEGPAADCTVTEGYLFGLVPFRHLAPGATGVGWATSQGSKGARMSKLSFETPGGPQPLLTLSSNMNDGAKREVERAARAYFAGTERRLALRVGFYNVFALFGAPLTLLWLWIVWVLLSAPLGLFWPVCLEVDSRERVLRVRAKAGPRPRREIALGALATIEVSRSMGGWLGDLQAKSGDVPMPRGKRPELHLHLVLRDGERVVVRNYFKISDDSMQALRKALAESAGVSTT